jgi:hypothetical protein
MTEDLSGIDPYEMEDVYDEVNETIPKSNKEEKKDYLDDFEEDISQQNRSQPVMFNDEFRTENLVMWQLRVDWDRIEHIIRGHKPKIDEKGNEYFEKIDSHYLNEYGVNNILHFLSFYLSKEIFLARYTEEAVNLRLKHFSRQFINFFYNNLNEFGLDTPQKVKMAPMFCQSVIDLVDASYSRAIGGKTADLINKQFSVMQNQPIENQMNNQPNPQRKGMIQRMFG